MSKNLPDLTPIASILNPEAESSPYNLLPTQFRNYLHAVPEDSQDLSDLQLSVKACADEDLETIRANFWVEHRRACERKVPMSPSNFGVGVCTQYKIHSIFKNEPYKMAYILRPPAEYRTLIRQVISHGLLRAKEAVTAKNVFPVLNKHGEPVRDPITGEYIYALNDRIADVQRRYLEGMIAYEEGLPVHRSENKNFNVNAEISERRDDAPKTAAEMEAEVKRMMEELKNSEGGEDVIDVTPGKGKKG